MRVNEMRVGRTVAVGSSFEGLISMTGRIRRAFVNMEVMDGLFGIALIMERWVVLR